MEREKTPTVKQERPLYFASRRASGTVNRVKPPVAVISNVVYNEFKFTQDFTLTYHIHYNQRKGRVFS